MFDEKLASYALKVFKRDGIKVKTEHHIEELRAGLSGVVPGDDGGCFTLRTREEGEVGVGMCVWSTGRSLPLRIAFVDFPAGLMMNPFIQKSLDVVHKYPARSAEVSKGTATSPSSQRWALKRHLKTGGLMVDDRFRVKLIPQMSSPSPTSTEATMNDVFAIGDVSVLEAGQLPATAQVANQEAKWLGKRLNAGDLKEKSFSFKNLGVMTYLGNMRAIMQTDGRSELKGRTAWLVWRGAYLTQTISWRNKLLIPIYW